MMIDGGAACRRRGRQVNVRSEFFHNSVEMLFERCCHWVTDSWGVTLLFLLHKRMLTQLHQRFWYRSLLGTKEGERKHHLALGHTYPVSLVGSGSGEEGYLQNSTEMSTWVVDQRVFRWTSVIKVFEFQSLNCESEVYLLWDSLKTKWRTVIPQEVQ